MNSFPIAFSIIIIVFLFFLKYLYYIIFLIIIIIIIIINIIIHTTYFSISSLQRPICSTMIVIVMLRLRTKEVHMYVDFKFFG
jgi:hypothetical protein